MRMPEQTRQLDEVDITWISWIAKSAILDEGGFAMNRHFLCSFQRRTSCKVEGPRLLRALTSHSAAASMATSKSPAEHWSPATTPMCLMGPSHGALTVVSIFMALSTTNGAPALTSSPSLTSTSTTLPAMGAPTDPMSAGSLRSRVAKRVFFVLPSSVLSSISTTRGMPFISKNTSRLPLGRSSPIAFSLTLARTPARSSISHSSSMSSPTKNAFVGSRVKGPCKFSLRT
mmetsp:Transcript_11496/g.48194  ORF Transcript_11496/g.48194 Transcript_11496/m.48194 type:complete len:230 (+) Transcript_11496:463-1152(+)